MLRASCLQKHRALDRNRCILRIDSKTPCSQPKSLHSRKLFQKRNILDRNRCILLNSLQLSEFNNNATKSVKVIEKFHESGNVLRNDCRFSAILGNLSLTVRGVWHKTNDRLRSGSSNMFGFPGLRVRGVVSPPLGPNVQRK